MVSININCQNHQNLIHQHIYASPKPGMNETEFQRYWLEVHAQHYAKQIPQILMYKVNTRIAWESDTGTPVWSGVAEIWFRNETEQLASLQTPEFLEGARMDEPRWAAFWNTLVLDTDYHELIKGSDKAGIKLLILNKRRQGIPLNVYRNYLTSYHTDLLKRLPYLTHCGLATVRDAWYDLGEPRFDAIIHLGFTDCSCANSIIKTSEWAIAQEDLRLLVAPKGKHICLLKEHWVISPGERFNFLKH